MFALAKNYIKL